MNVCERFLNYVAIGTNSDENSTSMPSTPSQRVLGEYLVNELHSLGIENAFLDDKGYVYAFLEASEGRENEKNIGFLAHMDTSPSVRGDNIKARVIEYNGGDIEQSEGRYIREKEFEMLKDYVGQHLVITDGTTLLGADDKAGIAEIISGVEYLVNHPEVSHRGVAVCFTPDEEINRGTDGFDFDKFNAKEGYTLDGGTMGGIEFENFNAAGVDVTVHGVNIHPGSAKNKMKNAVLTAIDFINALPPAETPSHTEKYEGYYHVAEFSGDETEAKFHILIRDFFKDSFEKRKQFIRDLTDYMNKTRGEGTVETVIEDSYYNMREYIEPCCYLIENAEKAIKAVGVTPYACPIRGGTDGAVLSGKGLPCPNLPTGGENFHGVHEFVSVEAMEQMSMVVVELSK